MRKKFDYNEDYFKWFDKHKEGVKIINLKIKDRIVVEYEKLDSVAK